MKSEIAKKAANIILSCQNAEQLNVAEQYVKLYANHHTCTHKEDLLKLSQLIQSTGRCFRSAN